MHFGVCQLSNDWFCFCCKILIRLKLIHDLMLSKSFLSDFKTIRAALREMIACIIYRNILFSRLPIPFHWLSIYLDFIKAPHPNTLYMPMDLVFVLKWLKCVIGSVLYMYHLSGCTASRNEKFPILEHESMQLLTVWSSLNAINEFMLVRGKAG